MRWLGSTNWPFLRGAVRAPRRGARGLSARGAAISRRGTAPVRRVEYRAGGVHSSLQTGQTGPSTVTGNRLCLLGGLGHGQPGNRPGYLITRPSLQVLVDPFLGDWYKVRTTSLYGFSY